MYWSLAIPLTALSGAAVVAAADCTKEAFTDILKDHAEATINLVQAVPANGSFGDPGDVAFPTNATSLPPLCAVSLNIKSSDDSSYNFGLFLPDTTWNERFLATGNGGFGGGINWRDMGILAQYGFATMSTDTGHQSGPDDGSWGLNHPESIVDWAHRAMHGSVVLSKEIISAYYADSDGIKYSYYAGCSTGGRQGLKEVQMYPDSFDGISVGAPAWWTVHLAGNTLQQALYNRPESDPKHIDSSIFPAIVDEMTKQCDPQDGVTDGIVSDPFGCNFDYQALLCKPDSDSSKCLTPTQLTTLYKFYNPWIDTNETFVFPGIALGTDPSFALGPMLTGLGYGLFKYWVYNDTNWDYTKFSFSDVQFADTINPGGATADDFDMTPFMERGGKIIKYHGSADPLIPTASSIYFYKQVLQTLVPKGVNVDDFYRFFLIPGMNHCQSANVAPWYIASASQALPGTTNSVPGYEDADHDIILAMMKWVEQGEGPEQLIATKFVNDTPSEGVQSQRPLCPYPKQAQHTTGDPNEAGSWECKNLY
ncbi:tannase and feruloyl esterase [Hypoxylon sp. FL1284]|nr:tannase and feruloyl esterase [Hypoxylon sp. FL1284]